MESSVAKSVISPLAQPTRRAVFSNLAGAGEDGLTAGDLAGRTATPANTMSAHLLILTRAGLAEPRRSGRNIFYAARAEGVRDLAEFLSATASGRSTAG